MELVFLMNRKNLIEIQYDTLPGYKDFCTVIVRKRSKTA